LLRKGDIVKFGSGYYEVLNDWKSWFIKDQEDKKKFWQRDIRIPYYAQNNYAIVVNRYRWLKYKYRKFMDYGAVIMMITGNNIGHIRKYYSHSRPFLVKAAYPYYEKIVLTKPF